MVPAADFDSGNLRDLRADDPEGFLMVVAAKYRLLLTDGTRAESALRGLVWELAEKGINLPRVMDEYPEWTQAYFGDRPDFSEEFIAQVDRALEVPDSRN